MTVPYDVRSNLPTIMSLKECGRSTESVHLNELDVENINLTEPQKELLLWHYRLGHFNMSWVQSLMRIHRDGSETHLLTKNDRTSNCKTPLCTACMLGKQHRRGSGAKVETQKVEMSIRAEDLTPGKCVSIDHYESKVLGRLKNSKGKEASSLQNVGGTIFVDHASGFVYVSHQSAINALQTIKAKQLFEREARSCGVVINTYRGDNGIFRSQEFRSELESRFQTISFSGVGAHHQNGVAERAIRTIVESARTMMLHALLHWPDEVDMSLWPFAMDYAVYLYNRMPNKDTGVAPLELFCGSKLDAKILRSAHVWGCPAFVLDPKLQDGKKLPKWNVRSRRGQFLGFSAEHSSTIGLIRNVRTGNVSPQFHVVYDDEFTTVATDWRTLEFPTNWDELFATVTSIRWRCVTRRASRAACPSGTQIYVE